jgi:hypothetical protein
MLKQEEILVVEDTEVDINNRHMDRIRDSMLVIIRYVIFHSCPQLSHETDGPWSARYTPRSALICSNNPKLLLLLPPPLLEQPQPKDQMLGLNTPHTGLHTVMMSMILSVSFHSHTSSQANQ